MTPRKISPKQLLSLPTVYRESFSEDAILQHQFRDISFSRIFQQIQDESITRKTPAGRPK